MVFVPLVAWSMVRAQVQTKGLATGTSSVDKLGAILPIQGMITDVMADSLKRRVEKAKEEGVSVIIFDMDTPGGLVSSSIAIADLIRNLTHVKTVAWVNPNAHSGGSIVAVSCDEIVMSGSSRMGDSQVIMGGIGGASAVPDKLRAKAYSPVLADFRASARLNGYSQVLSEAFVIPEREVWWIENIDTGRRRFVFRKEKIRLVGEDEDQPEEKAESAASLGSVASATTDSEKDADAKTKKETDASSPDVSSSPPTHKWRLVRTYHDPVLDRDTEVIQPVVRDDQLLEMSAGEAYAYGFNKAIMADQDSLKRRYHLGGLSLMDVSWSESLAYWMTSIYVRGFLMLIIMLGAYVEFHTPGVGVPGLVALICLAVFVGAPYLAGLANVWEILLIVIGVVLIALEVFVIPGFGIAGISGIMLVVVGLLATFVPDEPGHTLPFFIPRLPQTVYALQVGIVTLVVSMGTSLVGMVMLSRYLPRTPFFRQVIPENPTPSEVMMEDAYRGAARVGDVGETVAPLRPAGKARFGSMLVDVVTQGDYLDRGVRVEVVERRGNHVVVRVVT